MNKVLQIVLYLIIIMALIVLTGFINYTIKEGKCSEVVIDITDEKHFGFISEGDITDLLNREFNTPISQKISEINTYSIEKKLLEHQAVEDAEVYISIDGKLVVRLWQREPIIRVFSKEGSFYIDDVGKIMPVSRKFTAHVPVVSGNINIPIQEIHQFQLGKSTDIEMDTSLYNDLYELASFIHSKHFWKAQIEQVYVNKDSEFELIPRVGNHTIVLGGVYDLEKKFKKLEIFYEQGLSKTGWNEYEEINLKFKNQVVCTKRY